MKPLYDFKTINEAEDLDQSLHSLHLISINISVLREDFYCTSSRPLLFDCGDFTRHITHLPRLEVEQDYTGDEFGRAYYESRDFQFTEFHVTLCSVDELKHQIEAKIWEFEQNNIISVECVVKEERHSSLLDCYFAEDDWNEDLSAWIFTSSCQAEPERNPSASENGSTALLPFFPDGLLPSVVRR